VGERSVPGKKKESEATDSNVLVSQMDVYYFQGSSRGMRKRQSGGKYVPLASKDPRGKTRAWISRYEPSLGGRATKVSQTTE